MTPARPMLTADTITDAQIRELMKEGGHVRVLCRNALDDAPVYLKKSIIRDARRRLAEILNARGIS